MNKFLYFVASISLFLIFGCDRDDNSNDESWLAGALTSAKAKQLEGNWAIFQLVYSNQTLDVPVNFEDCGRDFFSFIGETDFIEYIFSNSFECTPELNQLNFSLSNGIINITNGFYYDQWVITELTANKLVFKFEFDTDSDGHSEIIKAICHRYEPPIEVDAYSNTFQWDNSNENLDKVKLKWRPYKGFNTFEKYEIYRLDEGCNISNTNLIATITDVNTSHFIDETAPNLENICYIFKLYTNKGLLGESTPVTVYTNSILANIVNLAVPVLNHNKVTLNWEQYQGYHFSHYVIETRNYSANIGSGFYEVKLAELHDIETTTYEVDLPYFSNPVFVIHAYNTFGLKSLSVIEGTNQQSTSFIREEILPINSIKFKAFSPNETVLYYSDYSHLYRYNYESKSVESSVEINSSSTVFLKVFESKFGTEVIINKGNQLKVYDTNLNFKYNLNVPLFSFDNLNLNEDGYWLLTDRTKLYSLSREANNLTLINSHTLYNEHFSTSDINTINLGQHKILVGNAEKNQGLIVEIDSEGMLTSGSTSVNFNTNSQWYNTSLFSEEGQYILNIADNKMYSTNTYTLLTTLNQDFFASFVSNDGSLIIGSNNNPKKTTTSFHEKKVRTFSYPDLNEQVYDTHGYPCFIFQNHLGQWVSVSKGLIGSLDSYPPENDIFIEIIE